MLAYVRDIQRQEKVEEVELLKHQKWSGAELVDKMVNVASGGGKREFRLAAELKGMATLSWKISHLEGQWSVCLMLMYTCVFLSNKLLFNRIKPRKYY